MINTTSKIPVIVSTTDNISFGIYIILILLVTYILIRRWKKTSYITYTDFSHSLKNAPVKQKLPCYVRYVKIKNYTPKTHLLGVMITTSKSNDYTFNKKFIPLKDPLHQQHVNIYNVDLKTIEKICAIEFLSEFHVKIGYEFYDDKYNKIIN